MKRIATLAAAIAFATPGSALAAGSSECQAYQKHCEPPATTTEPPPSTTATTHTTSAGTLPFTGLDVALLAAGGGTLLGAGFAVRRLSRRLD